MTQLHWQYLCCRFW